VFLSVPPRQPGKTEQSVLRGMLDFGIGLFSELPAPIRRQTLWTDRCVCVFRRGHPLLGKGRSFPLDLFKALPHIELTPDGDWLSQTQSALNDAGVEINLVVGVSHFSCVGSIVEASDLVAVIPSRYAEAFASLRIETRQLPVPTPEFNYELIWHERSDRHPAHRWFRDLLLSFCSDLFAGKRPSV
jgi:DNA-binding transcriptional LysR family regulator